MKWWGNALNWSAYYNTMPRAGPCGHTRRPIQAEGLLGGRPYLGVEDPAAGGAAAVRFIRSSWIFLTRGRTTGHEGSFT